MKFNFCLSALMIVVSALISSCGKAPFLHHGDESGQSSNSSAGSVNQNDLCRFRWDAICAQVRWLVGPLQGYNTLQIDFVNEQGQPADLSGLESHFSVEGFMPDPRMLHGTAPVVLEWKSPSRVEVQQLYFMMAGRWHVIMRLFEREAHVEVRI